MKCGILVAMEKCVKKVVGAAAIPCVRLAEKAAGKGAK